MKKQPYPLWKNIKVDDVPQKPIGFYASLEGGGVNGNEILFGTEVSLVFHIPALHVDERDISLGLTVIPCGIHWLRNADWYKTVLLPCEETEVCFSFATPTKAEWKNTQTPGFSFTLDVSGLIFYQIFLSVRLVKEPDLFSGSNLKELGFDLEEKIPGIVARVKKFEAAFTKRHNKE